MHVGDDDDADDDQYHDCDTTDRIVMARCRRYADSPDASSPVHALAETSRCVSRIHLLHEERKRLVAQLRARRAAQKEEEQPDEWEDDHDGLGDLFASKRAEAEATAKRQSSFTSTEENGSGSKKETQQSSTGRMQMDHHNNFFGLGTTAASVSTLAAVTATVQNKLQPYYSPTVHASEEHFYELYSFVAVQALSSSGYYYLGPSHVAWAVREHRTADRLRAVQEWMSSHVEWLKGQLKDCEGATEEGDGP